jgi:hypothetical protein
VGEGRGLGLEVQCFQVVVWEGRWGLLGRCRPVLVVGLGEGPLLVCQGSGVGDGVAVAATAGCTSWDVGVWMLALFGSVARELKLC